jgi:hypothetical protein
MFAGGGADPARCGGKTMASTTARTALSPKPPAGPPLRQLWQVPTFFLGLFAFAGVLLARPLWQAAAPPAATRDLAALRQLLAEPGFDQDRALVLADEVLRQALADPRLAGEAHFLAGSVHVALAERARGNGARDHWRKARAHLEQAEALGVPEGDALRLVYRLGKAGAQTEQTPPQVIEHLARSVEGGASDPADAARGYALLADAYLHLPSPDLEAALAANEKELAQPVVDEALLAPARLLRGELLLRLNRTGEAQEVLKDVGDRGPPAVLARARRLLAESLEKGDDPNWKAAAAAWREVLDDHRVPPPDRPAVLYHLGMCANAAGLAEAAAAWEECVRFDAPGDETPAAALGLAERHLAELRQGGDRPEAALTAFGRAVRDVNNPGEWHNALVGLARARELFEAGCRAYREGAWYDEAIRLALLYERLAPAGKAQELRAQAAEAWAQAKLGLVPAASPNDQRRLLEAAQGLLVQAGEGYEQSAVGLTVPADQADRLWRSAGLYLDGRDPRRAAAALQRFLKIAEGLEPPLPPGGPAGPGAGGPFHARLGEGRYKLAEAQRALGQEVAARASYLECLKWPGRYAFRARYELAVTKKVPDGTESRWTDEAQHELEHNLELLRGAGPDDDNEAREKTLFALGDLYFERLRLEGMLTRAINSLEEALEQFPDSPQAANARYQLAESYRLRAEQLGKQLSPEQHVTREVRLRINMEVVAYRQKAVANYDELSKALLAKFAKEGLTAEEDNRLVYASFKAADVRYMMGGYEESGRIYEALAERYKRLGRVEYYNALAGLVRSYTMPRSPSRANLAKAQKAIEEIRVGLSRLDAPTRRGFEEWLRLYDRPASGGRQPPDGVRGSGG